MRCVLSSGRELAFAASELAVAEESTGVAVQDARKKLGSELAVPPECVELVSATGHKLVDDDVVPFDATTTVVINRQTLEEMFAQACGGSSLDDLIYKHRVHSGFSKKRLVTLPVTINQLTCQELVLTDRELIVLP